MSISLAPAPTTALSTEAFTSPTFTIKRPWLSMLGRKFHVYGQDGQLVMFVKHPLLKLKTEFHIYTDEAQTRAVATIKARQAIALNIVYDVTEPETGRRLGALQRRGLKSIVRDTWEILDDTDRPVGQVQETGAAILRRLLKFLTGKWEMQLDGMPVARIRELFRFFIKEYALDLTPGLGKIDPRFAIAAALLALMAESQRESR